MDDVVSDGIELVADHGADGVPLLRDGSEPFGDREYEALLEALAARFGLDRDDLRWSAHEANGDVIATTDGITLRAREPDDPAYQYPVFYLGSA